MAAQSLGNMLKNRREELGYTLDQAARATNIRSQMLDVFERGDYKNYPPSGHVQGMLSSYAKYLGFDPRIVLDAYSREVAEFSERDEIAATAHRVRSGRGRYGEHRETGTQPIVRSSYRSSGSGVQMDERLAQEHYARNDDRYKSGSVKVVSRSGSSSAPRRFSRRQGAAASYSSRQPYDNAHASRTRQGTSRQAPRRSASFERAQVPESMAAGTGSLHSTSEGSARGAIRSRFGSSSQGADRRSFADDSVMPAHGGTASRSRTSTGHENTEDTSVVGRVRSAMRSVLGDTRSRLIALAVVLLVIAVAVAANILISTAGNDDAGVINVIGGAKDTTKTDTNSKNATATITTTNGTPIAVHIEVAEGATSLVNVTFDDDNAYNGTAVGPWSRDFQVTESMTATFGNPDAVTVTENGNEVQVEKNEDGTGKIVLKIKTKSTAGN